MSKTFQAIPTNLITGFLGSGKTTVILELLKSRPENSRWAVLVNEFGDVGIDGALFENKDKGLFIKEVPGGCLCCAAGLPLQMSLNLLIKQAQPERILIEPTGVGHPKKVMETLTGEFYNNVLDVRATICLVEAKKLQEKKYLDNETFMDQIQMSDILLASKADLATAEELSYFKEFSQYFKIPKEYIEAIEFGSFPIAVLDIKRNEQRLYDFPDTDAKGHSPKAAPKGHSHTTAPQKEQTEEALQKTDTNGGCDWKRFENNGHDYYGCGWIFNKSIVFDEMRLEQWVNNESFSRVKGIFHTNNGWLLFNRSEQAFTKQASVYNDDSRVELIESDYHDWNLVEDAFLNSIEKF